MNDIWMNFAYILNGKVMNVACFLYTGYTDANINAKSFCEDNSAFAVDVTHIPVQVGDDYIDGKFYRIIDDVAEIIYPFPSIDQQVLQNTIQIDKINAQIYYTSIMTDTLIEEE